MMDESQLVGEDGSIKPEIMERATALIAGIAELCQHEEPAVVLFVLEAALTEQISMFAPPLGDLFTAMMRSYKQRAAQLLSVLEMLKKGGVTIEEIMAAGDGQGDINPDEPQGLRETPEPSDSI
jgi:hypothetical protein